MNKLSYVASLTHIRLDAVWVFTIFGLAVLWLVEPATGHHSALFIVEAVFSIAPFLLASAALAAAVKASGADQLIAKAFQQNGFVAIFAAAIAGAFSPFCSCGVIPIIAALLAMGVPLPAVMAFWLASPLMDPAMFFVTTGTMGVEFALYKVFAAVGTGILGGLATYALSHFGLLHNPLRKQQCNSCGASILDQKQINWRFWNDSDLLYLFKIEAVTTTLFLSKWLVLAYFLESLMVVYVPDTLIPNLLGGEGIAPIITATLLGVPAYLNGYAALPLVASLIDQGMQPGAGMAFLLAGGVTSLPAATAVFAISRPPVFLTYLLLALVSALTFGVLYQIWILGL